MSAAAPRAVGVGTGEAASKPTDHAMAPVSLALREGLRRFVSRRVRADHVDDLVQDILLRMQEHADDLRDEARIAGWAFRIAQRVVADHHRSKHPDASVADSSADEIPDATAGEENVNEIVAGWLRPMLGLLPDEYAEALRRVDEQGMSQKEFAEIAGLSLSGAKSRVQRGRRMLEEIVRACCDIELDARGNVIGYQPRNCNCGDKCP